MTENLVVCCIGLMCSVMSAGLVTGKLGAYMLTSNLPVIYRR